MAKSKPYQPGGSEPFKLSRSKIDLFMRCERCFVLEVRYGVKAIKGYPFTLNVAVDGQLKKEFDIHRENQTVPEIFADAGLDLVPFKHEKMDQWRHNFTGVQAEFGPFLIFGAVDDVWADRAGQLVVVDYKATGRQEAVTALGEGEMYDSYRRQMEIYQWLLRRNGFGVLNRGYWVYATATQKQDVFDGTLHFEQNLVSYDGDDSWVEGVLQRIESVLDSDDLPWGSDACDTCRYVRERNRVVARFPYQDEQPEVCATCHEPKSKAVYGMLAGDPGPGYVAMGCVMNGDGSDPQWVCKNC